MAKYGTFVKTEQFGNKFFSGKLVRSYKEPPIHFLEGKTFIATAPLHTGFKAWCILCVVFWEKAVCSHKASFHLGMKTGTRGIKPYNAPASLPGRRNRVKPGAGSRLRFTYRTDMNYRSSHIFLVIYYSLSTISLSFI